jgi:uncharacterized repeat protein (TIGR02543 family)
LALIRFLEVYNVKKSLRLAVLVLLLVAIVLGCSQPGSSTTSTYTVTYNANGTLTSGSVPTDGNKYQQGAKITVLGNTGTMVRTGFTFAGWNTAVNGGGTTYAAGATFTMGSSNVTLYAVWTTNPTYTVSYNANATLTSGSVPTDSNNYLPGATIIVLGNTGTMVLTGSIFSGWNTQANGSGTTYTPGQTFTMGTSNVTLYAVWTIPALYVTNYGSSSGVNGISPYTIGSGGVLSAIITGTSTTGSGPDGVAISPNGKYLYVANYNSTTGANGISAYTIGTGGALSAITLSTAGSTTGSYPSLIAISPNGNYLYVTNYGSTGANGISAYAIGTGGALTANGTFTTGTYPYGIAISPNGNYLYVANYGSTGSNGISAYTIGSDGALTVNGTFTTGSGPAAIAINPNGNCLYVVNYSGSNGISAYTIGSGGALSAITSGTFVTGTGPRAIAISPNGNYLYVANYSGLNGISAYTIGSGGALSAITTGTFTTGPNPYWIAISPNGNYLYVTNYGSTGSNGISGYTIGSDGSLATNGTFTTGPNPVDIAIMP